MNLFKKSQMLILTLTLMISVAAYINYKYNPEREKSLGQTVYVSSNTDYQYDSVKIYGEQTSKNDVTAASTQPQDDAIAVFKYDRDNMFSELSENYRDIILNSNTETAKVNEYQVKLNDLIQKKNIITMVENIIKAKGIKDIVIIPANNDNFTVVIKSDVELKKEQIAQIQQLLVEQFNINASKITITVKK